MIDGEILSGTIPVAKVRRVAGMDWNSPRILVGGLGVSR
ncbi:MAG: hypothetical protein ACXV8U_15420 [Methylobacter sp.]